MNESLLETIKNFPLHKRSIETVARVFAPESMILSDKHVISEEERLAAEALAEQLEPGDIILVLSI